MFNILFFYGLFFIYNVRYNVLRMDCDSLLGNWGVVVFYFFVNFWKDENWRWCKSVIDIVNYFFVFYVFCLVYFDLLLEIDCMSYFIVELIVLFLIGCGRIKL